MSKPYLKIRDEPEKSSLKYELNARGWKALFVSGSVTENDNQEEKGGGVPGECVLRPHYLRSKHFIRRTGCSDDSWFVELKKCFDNTEDGTGFKVYWRDFRAEVYRESIQIRIDMPMEECSVEEMFSDYLELRERFLGHVVDRLNGISEDVGIQVRSNPELVECSMVTQEWAEFDSAFANWYMDNRSELQDDETVWGGLFIVRNERDERIAAIDCSEGKPEFEWVHSEEAKNHLQNMKDLVLWGASMEITPQDFSNLKWLRENFRFFESFHDRLEQMDELGDRVEVVEDQVDENTERLSEVSSHAERNEEVIESVSGQVQRNRDEFYEQVEEQDEKIHDTVNRVEAVQKGLVQVESRVEQGFQDVEKRLDNREEIFQTNLQVLEGKLDSNVSMLADAIQSNNSANEAVQKHVDVMEDRQDQLQRIAELLTEEHGELRYGFERNNAVQTAVLQEIQEVKKNSLVFQVRRLFGKIGSFLFGGDSR